MGPILRQTVILLTIVGFAILAASNAAAQPVPAQRCSQVSAARFYWHYTCVEAEFERMQTEHPDIAKFYTIGQSVQDRPMFMLEVANFAKQTADPSRPGFYLDATHHGNEIQGTEAAMILARKITSEYGTNETVTRWVDTFNIYINPVVNPDGNMLNQRQNANQVDLNRNYPFQHGERASAAGSAGASEPETQANVEFMRSHDLDAYVSLHTGTWDFVVPRCDPGTPQGRLHTDDEALYEYTLTELLGVTGGMGFRGASGTGESICWAYDVIETWSLLPEVSTEQNQLFGVQETEELNGAMEGIYWMLDRTGRYGSSLNLSLIEDATSASKVSIQIANEGLQVATNWTFELNYEGSRRAPLLRGNQPISSGETLIVPVPKNYLVGNVSARVAYQRLNVDPRLSDPDNGRTRDPHMDWVNFTAQQAQQVAAGTVPTAKENAPAVPLLAVLATVGLVLARRRQAR